MRKILKIFFVLVYVLLFAGVVGKLFFEKQFDAGVSGVLRSFSSAKNSVLTIGFSEPYISLSPLSNDAGSRARLLHIYEPLVRVTPDLQMEPALAISYGALDDLTWEFRLRPNVLFHDDRPLVLDDVIFSLTEAQKNPASGVKDLASTIQEIKKVSESIFHITTDVPDPLLLQKISALLIFPKMPTLNPVGTGHYEYVKEDRGVLTVKLFENYWGVTAGIAQSVILKTFTSKDEKNQALRGNSVDIVANVPPDTAKNFHFSGFALKAQPSLEVNFLMFNVDKVFKEKALRQAVALALSSEELAKLTQGFASPVYQFVGNGIFGYDPGISKRITDSKQAEELVKSVADFFRVATVLDLPKGLEVLGLNVKETLRKIGIDVTLNFLSSAELGKKITSRQSEFFFFGWKADLGDASDFLTAVVHSPSGEFGQFNGSNYKNSEVDRLIELAQATIKQQNRLEKLRAAMRKITVDDVIGVPLFSPEILYGVSTKLTWTPRVDGYILAQEVKM